MSALVLEILSWVLLVSGSFLGISGAVGILRFPDFYTRIHAASVTDTLCAILIIAGLILQSAGLLMILKLLLVLFILTYTAPTAAHLLAKAALHGGLVPWQPGDPEPKKQKYDNKGERS